MKWQHQFGCVVLHSLEYSSSNLKWHMHMFTYFCFCSNFFPSRTLLNLLFLSFLIATALIYLPNKQLDTSLSVTSRSVLVAAWRLELFVSPHRPTATWASGVAPKCWLRPGPADSVRCVMSASSRLHPFLAHLPTCTEQDPKIVFYFFRVAE